jgi:hypothetical protein
VENSAAYVDKESFCRSVTRQEVIANNYNLLPAAYVNRGHLKAAGGPTLHDVIHSPLKEEACRSLERVADLTRAFEEALRMVEAQVHLLEQEVHFKDMALGDLLERADERLGEAEEPEVLTCTESGGLVLIVTSPEMIRRYDGISFGTVQRRRRAPVERFLELKVNFPVGASLTAVSALLDSAQDGQFASRNAERAIKSFIKSLCERLR